MSVTTAVVARGAPAPCITALPSGCSWARPSSPEAPASSARMSFARSRSAATSCGCSLRRGSRLDHLSDLELERASGDVTDRRAVRRAMEGVDRVFHLAGTTSMRPEHRGAVFELNVKGTRIVLEEALAAEVERVVHTSSVAAIGPAKPRRHRGREPAVHRRPPRDRLRQLEARGRGRGAAARRARAAGRDRQPLLRARSRRSEGDLDGAGAPLSARRIPAYVDGGLNIVDVRDVARGHLLADEKGEMGERYILAGRNFTLDRLFADFARISGREQPPVRLPGRPMTLAVEAMVRAGLPLPVSPDEVRSATQWWTYRNTKARKRAGLRAPTARGDARGRRAVADGAARRPRRTARGPQEAALAAFAPLLRAGRAGVRSVSEEPLVLYRCPTPTNVLCPCGAVARRLGKLGLEHRTERVPYRRPAGRRSRS